MATATRTRRRSKAAEPATTEQAATAETATVETPLAEDGQAYEDAPTHPGAKLIDVDKLLAHPDNLRTEAKPHPGLVANLKTEGVRALVYAIVVTAHPEGGGLLIIDGHERTLSFQEAGLQKVPAVIRPDLASRAEHIVAMLRTAVHRRELTPAEQARGIQQLSLEGLSDHQISRQTGFRRPAVKQALAVAGLDAGTSKKVASHDLDLAQAATVAEFADDPKAVDDLINAAQQGPVEFDRAAARARNNRKEEREHAARVAELTEAGVTVLDRPPAYDDRMAKSLSDLRHDDQALTPQTHATCPGNVVAFQRWYSGGYRETWYCADWKTHGHTDISSGRTGGKMSEEEKAERRTVIANNKAMKAANEVRRNWIKDLLARRAAPKGAARFVAETMISRPYHVGRWMGSDAPLLDELLGVKTSRHDRTTVPTSASDSRCVVYMLAAIAAAHEDAISNQSWRHPDAEAARWLDYLLSLGYPLDPVEQIIVDTIAQRDKAQGRKAKATTQQAAPTGDAPAGDGADPAGSAPAEPNAPAAEPPDPSTDPDAAHDATTPADADQPAAPPHRA